MKMISFVVICLRNGKLCLMIRINDSFRKHWIDNKIDVFLIKGTISKEGEVIPNFIKELDLEPHGMLFWPVEIVHEITPSSPLWNISAKNLMTSK
ncbi:hypothetical protein NQ314_003817 [Rhamnusium bicolor]|uniref:Inward rectifier potassium channel C-terminal domain-containing protein n=1 Tax=Rhamnusium bicolor TaxID=1586634 RepID=A0AAV8ZL15_9CUCU|nr:hypothetical protein NQ314_003817 [Rhamnusium bicolor]